MAVIFAPNQLVGLSFYFGRSFTYAMIVPNVDTLVNAGLCRHHPGLWLSNGSGFQSAMQATPTLLAALLNAPAQYCAVAQPIWLRRRNEGKELVTYKNTSQTVRWRRQIDRFNDLLSELDVRLPTRVLTLHLHRVFSGSWNHGGRFYGSHQNVKKEIRRSELTVNGSHVREADIAQLHPTLLYAEHGLPLHGDAYDIAGFMRDDAKVAFNILVNAANEREAIWAMAERLDEASQTKALTPDTSAGDKPPSCSSWTA
jgi:hypothetical protein